LNLSVLQQTFVLSKLSVAGGQPVRYGFDRSHLNLADLLGAELTLRSTGRIFCCSCGKQTPKSYAQGHCYRCFKRLARCDLCVMAPHRCHFAAGTCREPQWGEDFCMQPHWVYLANVTGLKVGITRRGQERIRWMDQGAVQARLLARANSRQAAGELEIAIAAHVSDRAQWRSLVAGSPPPLDLDFEAVRVRALVPEPPKGVTYLEDDEVDALVHDLTYPIDAWPSVTRLNFRKSKSVAGVLRGIKGQYLLFDTGVFNVREHGGYEIELVVRAQPAKPTQPLDDQMELL
jgi:hypothetical protein